jgi:TPR repeat protein
MALHYFTEAAARDNPDALIRMAEQNTANPLQVRKAFAQVQKAANKGYIPGQYLLALHYLKGTGVTQNCILGVTVCLSILSLFRI